MLEVLISIVVLSFGLLGIAGLQAFALKNNHSASMRSTATVIATDIIDRMKANVQGMVNGEYHAPNPASYTRPTADCTASGATCSPTDMAAYDRWQFANAVATRLPGGVGVICVDNTPNDGTDVSPDCDNDANAPNQYVVKIWWTDERNAGATADKLLFTTTFNP
jgi:type IV pilus assembly protein PilV